MKKKVIIIPLAIVASLALAVAVPFVALCIRTANMNAKYDYLKADQNYSSKVEVNSVELVNQHVSCGYATIEMMSDYYGNKVTEDELKEKNNGGVSTSSSGGFLNEIKRSIPNKEFVKKSYLKNDAFLKNIHDSIANSNPVAIEWAAKYEDEWTLHFSLVTGLDLANNKVTIYNPYGEIENITSEDFIDRTTFKAYKNIPLFLNFGFAFGAFEKNTIFYAV